MRRYCLLILAALIVASMNGAAARGQQSTAVQVTWDFDNLNSIGGFPVRVEGQPRVISSPVGKAIEFDGTQDSLFVENHPLAGADTFTWEAIFRPDGGAQAQRWFHLAERDRETGQLVKINPTDSTGRQDSSPRLLFELRVNEDKWYLDAFATPGPPGDGRLLMFPDKMHPLGRWYHVAQVYDGKMHRSYVNGELQGEAPLVDYKPQGVGAASIGVRMNKVDYFHGAIASRIVRIGNSRGIRVRKGLLEQAQLPEEVELQAEPDRLVVRAAHGRRAGWAAAAKAMRASGDDQLLDGLTRTRFDERVWRWR